MTDTATLPESLGYLFDRALFERPDAVAAIQNDGRLTFGTRWAIGDFDIDELIDTAETIVGLPFVRMEHVIAYKAIADRSKDRAHLAAVEAYLDGR